MRKSNLTKKEKAEIRRRRNAKFMSFFIIFIMVGAIFGFVFSYNPSLGMGGARQIIEEFGLELRPVMVDPNMMYRTTILGQEHHFFLTPNQVLLNRVDDSIVQAIENTPFVGIGLDNAYLESGEYMAPLNMLHDQLGGGNRVTLGMTHSIDETPPLTCDLANEQFVVILPVIGTGESFVENNCVILYAFSPADMLFTVEHLRYRLAGLSFE